MLSPFGLSSHLRAPFSMQELVTTYTPLYCTYTTFEIPEAASQWCLISVRFLKSHLNIVPRSHNLIAWWPLGAYATDDRLAGLLIQYLGKTGVTTDLKRDIIVRAKEERNRVSSSARAICCSMNGTLENVICTISICGDLVSDFCTAEVTHQSISRINLTDYPNEIYIKDNSLV